MVYIYMLFKKRLEDLDLEKEIESQKNSLANLEAILSAQEKERKRIADDLHDEIGATLSLVQKNLNYIKKNQQDGQYYESELSQSIELVDHSIQSIRNISKELIPSQVIQLGIVKAIKQHIEFLENPAFTTCQFDTNIENELEIEQDDAIDIYRIYMELITNILKHSNTTKISVKCTKTNHEFVLSILHNGIGLTEKEYEERQLISQGLGLKSLSNRVKRIGAQINFERKDKQYLVELKYQLKKQ
jgi:signal transduction histidine kinase